MDAHEDGFFFWGYGHKVDLPFGVRVDLQPPGLEIGYPDSGCSKKDTGIKSPCPRRCAGYGGGRKEAAMTAVDPSLSRHSLI
ncbi:hypothetical protein BN871_DZ_00060 [Paenibacillus sp. P22]|nr:hypothetical protein BN871_DZ_00060 [Paenibacillus sp. P22]